MASLGTASLWVALALACYGVVAYPLGARLRDPQLTASARNAFLALPVALGVAVFALVTAFVSRDFSVRYVAEHSNLAMPPLYTWVAFYAGNEGSLLYIAFIFSVMTALAFWKAPPSSLPTLPYTALLLGLLQVFFLGVMLSLAHPFAVLDPAPPDGRGINPLLTHPGMFFHPPMQMAGLVSVALPFGFTMGALLSGRQGDEWLWPARVWGLISWIVQSLGLLLGAWWAYTILGWGGYWAWDPVENAALMPWLATTAFLHSLSVQRRRGLFRRWNIALIVIAMGLAEFGMFLNRGGPVPSVHSFAASTMGWVFLAFMGVTLAFSFFLFFLRFDALRGPGGLESALSREASFLGNNLLLLAIAFVTLWGVLFPVLSELARGVTVSVARPFYDRVNGPLLLALVVLMGIGPLLPWRRADGRRVGRALRVPVAGALALAGLLALVGVRNPLALLGFSACAFVAVGILAEWARGVGVRLRRGENPFLAFARLVAGNRPRYGGYIVHLGILLVGVAVVGSTFYDSIRTASLAPGESVSLGPYTVRYEGVDRQIFPDRIVHTATVTVYREGAYLTTLHPSQAFYPAFQMAQTRAGIRSTPVEDLYVVATEFGDDDRAVVEVRLIPMVFWLWTAGPVLVVGTLIALWPSRRSQEVHAPSLQEGVPSPVFTGAGPVETHSS